MLGGLGPETTPRDGEQTHRVAQGLHLVPHPGVASEQSLRSRLDHLRCRLKADTSLTDTQAEGTRRGVLLEPIAGLHDQEHHIHALALAQRDGVALPSLPSPLLPQMPYLGLQVEALQSPV